MDEQAIGSGPVEGEFLKMVSEFLERGLDRLGALEDACRIEDFQGMMASADAVKNNAVYAGFREICACAAEIGKCAREGDSEGIVIATSRMKKNFEQIVATLVFGEPKV